MVGPKRTEAEVRKSEAVNPKHWAKKKRKWDAKIRLTRGGHWAKQLRMTAFGGSLCNTKRQQEGDETIREGNRRDSTQGSASHRQAAKGKGKISHRRGPLVGRS